MLHQHLRLPAWALAAALTATAFAQTTTPAPETKKIPVETKSDDPKTQKADEDVATLEKVVVTGSRIPQQAGIATITPVVTISSEQFAAYGISTLPDLSRALPQLGPNTSGDTWTTLIGSGPSPGLSNRSSFSLGGLNLAASSVGGITLVLVDGHRLAKSGQSFSGQGNLEDYDLNGIPVDAIDHIDIVTGGASAIYGADAMAGVINIILKKNAGYNVSTVALRYDNTFDGDAAVKTATFTTSLRKGKFSLLAAGSFTETSALARRDRWFTATDNLKTFGGKYDNRNSYVGAIWTPAGTTYAIPSGSTGSSSVADFTAAGTAAMYDSSVDLLSISPSRERSLSLKANYDFSPQFNLYSEFRWNEKTSHDLVIPAIGYYYPAYVWGSGLTVPAGVAGNPFSTSVTLNKVFTDLAGYSTSTSRNPSALLGAEGDVHAGIDWHYDASASWTRSEQNYETPGTFDTTKLAAAIAAGKAPILIYDSAAGNPNAAGVLEQYLDADWNRERSDTTTYNGSIRGSLFTLPAGDIQLVLGGEWKQDRSTFSANPDSTYSSYLLAGTISRTDTAGFSELQVPIISGQQKIPGLNRLALNASARRDEYSDVGGATTKNVGAIFGPFSWLSVRASRSEGFKPASLWDLYAPYYDFGGYTFPGSWYGLYDPVLGQDVGTISTYIVGHDDLRPTTSISQNLGAVLDVPFVKGLSFTVDFTKTKITDALGAVDYQVLIDQFPDRVVRDATTNVITALDTSNVNTSSFETQSITYGLNYQRPTPWGDFTLHGTYTVPTVTRSVYAEGDTPTEAWLPKRASGALAWQRGPLGASVSAVYQGDFNMYPAYLKRGYDYTYRSYVEWNPSLSYDFSRNPRFKSSSAQGWVRAVGGLRASLTVVNVFDSEPSRASAGSAHLVQDYRGSRYVLELTEKF